MSISKVYHSWKAKIVRLRLQERITRVMCANCFMMTRTNPIQKPSARRTTACYV